MAELAPTRVVFVSEIPVAYRTGWFEFVRENADVELRVVYLSGVQSDRPWEVRSDARWSRTLDSTKLEFGRTGFFPRLSRGLGAALDAESPDFVVLPGWAHPASWLAARWCSKNTVPTGILFETWERQSETRIPAALTGRIRDRMIANASTAMPVGSRAAGFAREIGAQNVNVVHGNTCDAASISAATRDLLRHEQPTVLFVGRLFEHKGAGLLPDLAARLRSGGVRLQVMGDGPMRAEVAASAAEFKGAQPARLVHEAMAKAHVVVVPSLVEPWGVVVHEALAAGTPVVATEAVGSSAELLDGFEGGRVVQPYVTNLLDAVSTLIPFAEAPSSRAMCQTQAVSISYETATAELEAAVASVMKGRN